MTNHNIRGAGVSRRGICLWGVDEGGGASGMGRAGHGDVEFEHSMEVTLCNISLSSLISISYYACAWRQHTYIPL